MSVNLNVSDFSAGLFTIDQENKPADTDQFLKGLNLLASRALGVLKKPEDVELAFQRIKNTNLVDLSPQDKDNIDQRIQDVYKSWVKVTFGDYFRYVPRERLAKQCGPKFEAQYTSGMKEATDQELDLQSADAGPADGCPEDCKELILAYLQTGALPPEALGDNALNMLALAEQHQLEGLIQDCLDSLVENLCHENLDTFLEFTQQHPFQQLDVACLIFMRDNRKSISDELKIKYQEKLQTVDDLIKNTITLNFSSSGIIEVQVKVLTNQTADVLQGINKRFPIASLSFSSASKNNLPSFLEQIAPTLNNLQELIIWNETPTDNDLPKLKNLFPNLTALGNNAPFLKTFDEVKKYVDNFREPGEEDQESEKPLLRSLNLRKVPDLTDDQLDELTSYLQELYHLFISSHKITSLVAPKAMQIYCDFCTALSTLEAPKATTVDCNDCMALTTLKVPEAIWVDCDGCARLTILHAPKATRVDCDGCSKLTTLEAPKANTVCCNNCIALTTLEAPEAIEIYCSDCTQLTALEAPEATWIICCGCTALVTLEALEATRVLCRGCTQLTILNVPKADWISCSQNPILLINSVSALLVSSYRGFLSQFSV